MMGRTNVESPIILDLMLSVVKVLSKRGVKQPAALAIGREITTCLCSMSAGLRERIPKNINAVNDFTHKISMIYADIDGNNYQEVALKHGLSVKRVRELRYKKENIVDNSQHVELDMLLEESIIRYLPKHFQHIIPVVGIENANKILNAFCGAKLYLGRGTEHTKDTEQLAGCIGREMAGKLVGLQDLVVPSRSSILSIKRKHRVIEAFKSGKGIREIAAMSGLRYAEVMRYTKELRVISKETTLLDELSSAQETYDKNLRKEVIEELMSLEEHMVKLLPDGTFKQAIAIIGLSNVNKILNTFHGCQLYLGLNSETTGDIIRLAACIGVDPAGKLCGLKRMCVPSKRNYDYIVKKLAIVEAYDAGKSVDEIAAMYRRSPTEAMHIARASVRYYLREASRLQEP
jgi:Mor family transcriptional regulator